MASLKKSLDKFDLGTPMIAGMLGGTADHGEGADAEQDELDEIARTEEAANIRKAASRKKTRRAAATTLS